MNETFIKEQTERIKEVLGEESYAKISDSVAQIITENKKAIAQHTAVIEERDKLTKDNADLVRANGSLMQQIPMGEMKSDEPSHPQNIDFHAFLNKDGSFKS